MTPVLFVAWQDPEDRAWYTVGRLTRAGSVFRFEYTRGATRSPRFIPFGHMQKLDQVYESQDLFPLFANRLLAKGRPEYRNFVHWLGVRDNEDDPLALLARTGGMRETDSLMVFPCPEPTPNGEYRSKFFAQGLRYLPDYVIGLVNEVASQSRLFLMPDPQNEHDRMAIALRTGNPMVLIGYCPRYLTEDLHYLLRVSDPERIRVQAQRINIDAPIQLRLLCDLTAPWPSGFRPCSAEDFQVLTTSTTKLSRTAFA